MNPFEEAVGHDEIKELKLPELQPYVHLSSEVPSIERPKKVRLYSEATERLGELWLSDEFYETAGSDAIYLTEEGRIDLITLVHRLHPKSAPYESYNFIQYKYAGGFHAADDSMYFLHPLTAFFFARWMLHKYESKFLTRNNLQYYFSVHACLVVKDALDKFKVRNPLNYNYAMAGITGAVKNNNLVIKTPEGIYKLKLHGLLDDCCYVSPTGLMTLLLQSFKHHCDGTGDVLLRPGKHPPFFKPKFLLPLWQELYLKVGSRLTKLMLDVPSLSLGCAGCSVRDDCSFVIARSES